MHCLPLLPLLPTNHRLVVHANASFPSQTARARNIENPMKRGIYLDSFWLLLLGNTFYRCRSTSTQSLFTLWQLGSPVTHEGNETYPTHAGNERKYILAPYRLLRYVDVVTNQSGRRVAVMHCSYGKTNDCSVAVISKEMTVYFHSQLSRTTLASSARRQSKDNCNNISISVQS